MASFKEAFAAARKEKGAGKAFTWNGKSYSTNRADDAKKSASPSTRPKSRPEGSGTNTNSSMSLSGKASTGMSDVATSLASVKTKPKISVTATTSSSGSPKTAPVAPKWGEKGYFTAVPARVKKTKEIKPRRGSMTAAQIAAARM